MSWLKKMFGRLKDDDSYSDEASYQEESHINKPKDKNKEIEARVSYQYPKGEFRFPVIPDKRESGREERAARSEQRRQKRTPSKNEEPPAEKRTEPQEETPKKEKPAKKDEATRRPFRPTEIPSPIYGFSKPIQKDPIPFELKSSEPRRWRGVEEADSQEEREISEDRNEKVSEAPYYEDETLTSEVFQGDMKTSIDSVSEMNIDTEETVKVHTETSVEGETEESNVRLTVDDTEEQDVQLASEEKQGPFRNQEVTEDESAAFPSEGKVELTFEPEIEESDVQPADNEKEADRNHGVSDAESAALSSEIEQELASESATEEPDVQLADNEKEEPFRNQEVADDEPAASPLEGEIGLTFELETEESNVQLAGDEKEEPEAKEPTSIEEPVTEALTEENDKPNNDPSSEEVSSIVEEPAQEVSEEASLADAEQELQQEGEQAESEPASKRSHLPFNVLMLKQDKRMMDRKKRLEEMKTERVLENEKLEDRTQVEMSGIEAEENASFQEETVSAHQEEVNVQQPLVEDEEVSESIEPGATSEEQTQDEQETNAATEAYASAVEEDAPQQEKSSKRSHLPFNVLMLKQDKQKMDYRYEKDRPAASTTSKAEEIIPDDTSLKQYEELADQPAEDEGYTFPQLNFLSPPVLKESSGEWLESQRNLLNDTLANFNVRASVVNVTEGPSVTRFEVQPEPGVKVNKITNLADDIKLSLAARDIRIEAPIPGKHTIGIEVPNKQSRPVALSEIISSSSFQESSSPLTAALGLDISGEPIVTDLNKMPHGLIAGATGSGKSVCINSILISLLYKASPQDLKLLLIDPKMVELAPYNRMPHLVSPVITDVKAATAALKWAVEEMERRYELFAHTGVRDIGRYNLKAERNGEKSQKLPYLVIVIDELADLMMMSPADVEEAICRIAQKARACGIHLIIATQRPSVDVITGLIKANVPTRVAFSVSSGVDSRTIIDSSGAEKLLGKGDMLFLENGSSKPVRLQGTFVSDDEIDEIVNHVREQGEPNYLFQQDELLKKAEVNEQEDELFVEACEFVVDQGGASTSLIQRHFREIGRAHV